MNLISVAKFYDNEKVLDFTFTNPETQESSNYKKEEIKKKLDLKVLILINISRRIIMNFSNYH
jgi:hypothetical protein